MRHPSRIEIDAGAIEHNVAVVRRASGVALCAVLKADGYGLGGVGIARRLEACGVEMLAVYSPEQASALVDAGVTTPILILMPVDSVSFDGALYQAVRAGRVHVAAHSVEQLEALIASTELLGVRLPVHVEVDTGMSRGGARPALAGAMLERIAASDRVVLAGVYTHFASADRDDAGSRAQAAEFDGWVRSVRGLIPPGCATHMANTFGLFRAPQFHRDMVRVGLALLGYADEEYRDPARVALRDLAASLRPAVRWVSRIIHATRIEAGTAVGYGATWRAARPTRLGLAPGGYADGYPLSLGNRGTVGLETASGKRVFAPVVGAVSMDQITIDLTDAPADVGVGAPVELIGRDKGSPTHLPRVAQAAGTISHDLLCGLSARLERVWVEGRSAPASQPAGEDARGDRERRAPGSMRGPLG